LASLARHHAVRSSIPCRQVSTTLIPESPILASKLLFYGVSVLLIDDVRALVIGQHGGNPIDLRTYWKVGIFYFPRFSKVCTLIVSGISLLALQSMGFANIANCDFIEMDTRKNRHGQLPYYDVELTNQLLRVETCPDSFQTLLGMAGYLGDQGDFSEEK